MKPIRHFVSQAIRAAIIVVSAVAIGGIASAKAADNWAGDYSSPHGVDLTLESSGGGSFTGELTIASGGQTQSFPVQLRQQGDRLNGTFGSGMDTFPLAISLGEEPQQIVLVSDGSMFELSKKGGGALESGARNPLAATGTDMSSGQSAPAGAGNFSHPDGYFSMQVPSQWEANMMAGDVFELVTGTPGDLVVVVLGDLDASERGKPATQVMPSAMAAIDAFLAQNAEVYADSSRASTSAVQASGISVARSERPASDRGQSTTVWQGLAVKGDNAVILVSSLSPQRSAELMPTLDAAIASVSINRSWRPGELSQSGATSSSGRNVSFNGVRLEDATLQKLEGPTPVIPDGDYWYDNRSGMAGTIGGPTEAYLAPGLELGGRLSPQASGGATQVALNGRYLHPIDLAGLQYYFGYIAPGRYWMDGNGDYGNEGGPKQGNIIEDIALIEMVAAEYQAQMQQQLMQQVQTYGGQGGYYGQGGGYYNQGGGGSVYSHFPNLGASGTGVGVANFGNGDGIVNAGGVLWWPGK